MGCVAAGAPRPVVGSQRSEQDRTARNARPAAAQSPLRRLAGAGLRRRGLLSWLRWELGGPAGELCADRYSPGHRDATLANFELRRAILVLFFGHRRLF